MKKRLFTIVASIMLVLSLAACGIKAMTLQEIYKKDTKAYQEFNSGLELLKSQNSANYSDITIEFIGNTAVYNYTFRQALGSEYRGMFESTLENSFNSMAKAQVDSMRNDTKGLSSEPIVIIMHFNNPNGIEFYTFTYTEGQ